MISSSNRYRRHTYHKIISSTSNFVVSVRSGGLTTLCVVVLLVNFFLTTDQPRHLIVFYRGRGSLPLRNKQTTRERERVSHRRPMSSDLSIPYDTATMSRLEREAVRPMQCR